MTKNERILLADDDLEMREYVSKAIKRSEEKEGHTVVGEASSVVEVEKLLKGGLKPTVALVDNRFPLDSDGKRAATIIRDLSPQTKVVSFSGDAGLKWGDENWLKSMGPSGLIKALTELEH